MEKLILAVFFFCCPFGFLNAQAFSEAIEDNSFLIEEAYNQEDNVIQHISTGSYQRESRDFIYTFTQEWPAFSHYHQFSFAFSCLNLRSSNTSGFGDLTLNYRYQLFDKNNWAACSPRFSIILPTGNEKKQLGNGVTGFQVNIPVSKRLSEYFVGHFNAGATLLPGMDGGGGKSALLSYNLGGSLIFLASGNINFMLEYVYNYLNSFNGDGKTVYTGQGILNPGIRGAIDIRELQIVPGLAFPITFYEKSSKTDLYFYLSFEHPLKFY